MNHCIWTCGFLSAFRHSADPPANQINTALSPSNNSFAYLSVGLVQARTVPPATTDAHLLAIDPFGAHFLCHI